MSPASQSPFYGDRRFYNIGHLVIVLKPTILNPEEKPKTMKIQVHNVLKVPIFFLLSSVVKSETFESSQFHILKILAL